MYACCECSECILLMWQGFSMALAMGWGSIIVATWHFITQKPECPLMILDIKNCGLEDAHIQMLSAAITTNTSLTQLNMSGNQVSDKFLYQLLSPISKSPVNFSSELCSHNVVFKLFCHYSAQPVSRHTLLWHYTLGGSIYSLNGLHPSGYISL